MYLDGAFVPLATKDALDAMAVRKDQAPFALQVTLTRKLSLKRDSVLSPETRLALKTIVDKMTCIHP
jgi:hypothetical protein